MNLVSSYTKRIPVTKLGGENKVPIFRDFPPNNNIEISNQETHHSYSDLISTAGINTSKRLLPYKEQSSYQAHSSEEEVLHVCLENEYIKIIIFPEWGGRLISFYDKKNSKELLYNPEQIILRNLAIRNAWFAGGIEWNIGYYGHATHTSSIVNCCSFNFTDANNKKIQGIRIYDYEQMNKLWWQIDFILPPESKVLNVSINIYNDTDTEQPCYWWTNIAVTEENGKRVLSSNNISLWRSDIKGGFESVNFPFPKNSKIDYSYSINYPKSSEFFFDKPKNYDVKPWIATTDNQGSTFFECSTFNLPFRKVFCWGNHQGGENWQRLLDEGKGTNYFEIQAGLAPTQIHSINIKSKEAITFKHSLGHFISDTKITHQADWVKASNYICTNIQQIETLQEDIIESSEIIPNLYFTKSDNWGKVFFNNEYTILPKWLIEEINTTDIEKDTLEYRWYKLVTTNNWASYNTQENIEWIIDSKIQTLFEDKIKSGVQDWSIFLHLGIIYREQFNFELALQAFKKSIAILPNQFSYWGLIDIYRLYKNSYQLQYWIENCISYLTEFDLIIELLKICVRNNFWQLFEKIYVKIPNDKNEDNRLLTINIEYAMYKNEYDKALKLLYVFNQYLREGDLNFLDLWNKISKNIKKLNNTTLPTQLDYRMDI